MTRETKRALAWSALWVGLAIAFGVGVAIVRGGAAAEEFAAAYLLEKSLSVDNLFLFIIVFGALGIPRAEQSRVLTWGLVGALVSRLVVIAAGASLVQAWHGVTYIFGAILLVTSAKMLLARESTGESRLLLWLRTHLPWTPRREGQAFFVRGARGRWLATPLFVALVAIELTDVVFALDSIPAAFAVTDDVFLIASANILAVLGLRSLYIVLAGALSKIRYLKYGLIAVIAFAGAKLLAAPWVVLSPAVSVAIIAGILTLAVLASLARRRQP